MPVLTLPSSGPSSLTVRAKALVFEDPRSRALLDRIEQVAPSEATILLTGETGTGKEIVARQIHQLSRRAGGPFVAVNCGAFSENLVESELFGHEKGAFTGALQAKAGWFEAARGGTLFLDEVGDLPLPVQVKLLRVLQENEVVRLGSRQPIPIQVRLIAATNVDLQEAMLAGHFREDLFYRLNVVSLHLPPLRERPGDVPALAAYFCELYRKRLGIEPVELTPGALERLRGHCWPGNIRELENTVHHALLVCREGRIEAEDVRVMAVPLSSKFRPSSPPPAPLPAEPAPAPSWDLRVKELESVFLDLFELGAERLYERVEETLLRTAYRFSEQNQLQTARLLGMSRNVVRARLIQYGELAGQLRGGSGALEAPREGASAGAGALQGVRAPLRVAHPSPRRGGAASTQGRRHVRVGYQKFGRLLLVKALGQLDEELARHGVEVEWVEFPGGLQLVDALQAERLDLGVVGECPPVFAQAAHAPIVYLASEAAAPEAEAILVPAHSPLRGVADLQGRTVALNRGANVHYLVIRALEEVGLAYGDIQVAFLTPEEAEAAFLSGEVDAWAIWDPLLGSVRKKTGARVLRDGRGLTHNTGYYIASRRFVEGAAELVEVILSSVERSTRLAQSDLPSAARLLARESGMHPSALEEWLGGLSAASRMNLAAIDAQQEIADRLFGLNLVPQPVRVAAAQWSRSLTA